MKRVAIIQARYSSSRLPGKVLLDIADKPMLAWVVERARRARSVDQVVVATTTDPTDDVVVDLCHQRGYDYYRGSLYDVLDRYYQAARLFAADVIVRITADCPFIDPHEIDHVMKEFIRLEADFAANRLPPPWKRTYPIGLDTEICTFAALERAWKEAEQPHQREHVMPYLYEDHGEKFKVVLVNYSEDYGAMRWTVDTAEDLMLVREVVTRLGNRDDFSWLEVLALFQRQPELARINAAVQHKSALDVDDRLQQEKKIL